MPVSKGNSLSMQGTSDSTPIPVGANVPTHNQNVPIHKCSIAGHVNASVQEWSIVQATSDSTPRPVGVSAQHHVQTAINHKFSMVFYVAVNVPTHNQNVHASPQVSNNRICRCQCPRVIPCPGNQQFNFKTCRCECLKPRLNCYKPQVFNGVSCRCECPYPWSKYTYPQVFNGRTCWCQCQG